MKLVLVLVLVFVKLQCVFCHDNEMYGSRRDEKHSAVLSCPDRCVSTNELGQLIEETKGYLGRFRDWFVDGKPTENILPDIKPEKWDPMCQMWTSMRTCLDGCNDTTLISATQKRISEILVQGGIAFACDEDVRENYECLMKQATTPVSACDKLCDLYKETASKAVHNLEEGPNKPTIEKWVTHHAFSKNLCWYINCQLRCREEEILSSCAKPGVHAAKKGIFALGNLAEAVHFGYSSHDKELPTFAEECTSDQLIQGFASDVDETDTGDEQESVVEHTEF